MPRRGAAHPTFGVPIKAAMFSMPNAARPKVTNTAMGGKRQPGPLLKVHTERDDYFRTSAFGTFAGAPIEVPGVEVRQRLQVGKIGLNYRF